MFIISSQKNLDKYFHFQQVPCIVTCEVHYICFVNQSLMKIESKINEISSKVLSKVRSQLSFPPLNFKKKYLKIIKGDGNPGDYYVLYERS